MPPSDITETLGVPPPLRYSHYVRMRAWTCSVCDTEVAEAEAICPHCGEEFDGFIDGRESAPAILRCSACDKEIGEADQACPHCGAPFDGVIDEEYEFRTLLGDLPPIADLETAKGEFVSVMSEVYPGEIPLVQAALDGKNVQYQIVGAQFTQIYPSVSSTFRVRKCDLGRAYDALDGLLSAAKEGEAGDTPTLPEAVVPERVDTPDMPEPIEAGPLIHRLRREFVLISVLYVFPSLLWSLLFLSGSGIQNREPTTMELAADVTVLLAWLGLVGISLRRNSLDLEAIGLTGGRTDVLLGCLLWVFAFFLALLFAGFTAGIRRIAVGISSTEVLHTPPEFLPGVFLYYLIGWAAWGVFLCYALSMSQRLRGSPALTICGILLFDVVCHLSWGPEWIAYNLGLNLVLCGFFCAARKAVPVVTATVINAIHLYHGLVL